MQINSILNEFLCNIAIVWLLWIHTVGGMSIKWPVQQLLIEIQGVYFGIKKEQLVQELICQVCNY